MRILLFTGKGGVGKTTAAAATAVRLAESGRRVLVLSTDPAHSLGDAFGLRLRNEPTPVTERLDAAEIDTLAENDRAWARLRAYLGRVVARMDTDSIANDEMLLLPGLGELFSLLRILDHADADAYDVLVVDCAPTGESLALLTYPEKLGTALERVLPIKRKKAPPRPVEVVSGIITEEGRFLLRQRPNKGLLAGMWEFPAWEGLESETDQQRLLRGFREEMGLLVEIGQLQLEFEHVFSHRHWKLRFYRCTLKEAGAPKQGQWLDKEAGRRLAFAGPHYKVAKELGF